MSQNRRLLWFGYLERMEESSWHDKFPNFDVGDYLVSSRPRKICGEGIRDLE